MEAIKSQDNVRTQSKLKQVKVSVASHIATAFKEACAASNVSMAAELSRFMADYANVLVKRKSAPDYLTTRRRRRSAIRTIIKELGQIKAYEDRSLENTPENLVGSAAYDVTEEAITSLDDAIEALQSFWMVP